VVRRLQKRGVCSLRWNGQEEREKENAHSADHIRSELVARAASGPSTYGPLTVDLAHGFSGRHDALAPSHPTSAPAATIRNMRSVPEDVV
jgi:hypothetical protein